MSRARRWLAGALAAAAVSGILIHPAIYWPIYGWVAGEPFWNGRPSTYWRRQIERLNLKAGEKVKEGSKILPPPPGYVPVFLRVGPPKVGGPLAPGLEWLDKQTGYRLLDQNTDVFGANSGLDPTAVALLLELLGDPDATVRAFAVEGLCHIAMRHPETTAEVVPALQKTLGDNAQIDGKIPKPTVGDMARRALSWIDHEARGTPVDRKDW
jgi:hypothetical protein